LFIGRCANIDGNIGNPRTPAARKRLILNARWANWFTRDDVPDAQ